MTVKLIGAVLIILGTGGVGFSIAGSHRREVRTLQQLLTAVNYMYSELQYSLMPLPELCTRTAEMTTGSIRRFFMSLSDQLNAQISPHVRSCVEAALIQCDITDKSKSILKLLGDTLGCFDLKGQLSGLDTIRDRAKNAIQLCTNNQDMRLRSYQTLGLCAGAAIVIIFI